MSETIVKGVKNKLKMFQNVPGLMLTRDEICHLIVTIESQNKELSTQAIAERTMELYNAKRLIESQKEEIENQREIIAHQGKGLLQERRRIESLKAITELAVKGLKWYADRNNYGRVYTSPDDSEFYSAADSDQGMNARGCLGEIERLQNGSTS